MLNTTTINNLAKVLAPEVITYITESDEFIQLLHSLVPEALHKKLGELDDDLAFDLSLCILDKIILKVWE